MVLAVMLKDISDMTKYWTGFFEKDMQYSFRNVFSIQTCFPSSCYLNGTAFILRVQTQPWNTWKCQPYHNTTTKEYDYSHRSKESICRHGLICIWLEFEEGSSISLSDMRSTTHTNQHFYPSALHCCKKGIKILFLKSSHFDLILSARLRLQFGRCRSFFWLLSFQTISLTVVRSIEPMGDFLRYFTSIQYTITITTI